MSIVSTICQRSPLGGLGVALMVGLLAPLVISCSNKVNNPSSAIQIVSPHRQLDGRVSWDPNDEPTLVLSVISDDRSIRLDDVRWQQTGWQVDDSQWRGADLRVHVDSPGCGYGGQGFTVSALSPDGTVIGRIEVWMERYVCAGSPWLTE